MKPTVEAVIRRYDAAKVRKSQWNETYSEAQEYGTPQSEDVGTTTISKGDIRNDNTFTSIVEDGVQMFASRLMTTLFPSLSRWVQYKHLNDKENQFKDVIESIQERTQEILNQPGSMFYAKVHESFNDLAIGTGCVSVLPHPEGGPLFVDVIPLNQVVLEETVAGVPPNVYREYRMTKMQLKSTYPDTFHEETSGDGEDAVQEDLLVIDASIYIPMVRGKADEDAGFFHHYVILHKNKEQLDYRRFTTQPYIAYRWSKNPGEFYGRGPVVKLIPDIRVLNYMTELSLKNAEHTALRTYTSTDDRIINQENYSVQPGTILPVRTNSPSSSRGRSIEPLADNNRFEPGAIAMERLEQRVKDALLTDDMGPEDQPSKSPLEVSIRHRQLMKRIGSAYGRLQDELVGPLMKRILDLCNMAGAYQDIAMEWAANNEIGEDEAQDVFTAVVISNVTYRHPLSVMAKQEMIGAMETFFAMVVNSFGPNALAIMVKPHGMVEELAEVLGIPMDLLNSEAEMQALQQAAQQAIEQAGAQLPQGQQQ